MSKKTPAPPPPPDPYAVAQAQYGTNANTAVANSIVGNPNVVGPYGSTTYSQSGTTNVNGQEIPRYTQTTTLSPEQQKLYEGQTSIGMSMNDIAKTQLGTLGSVLGTRATADGLPEVANDFSADRARVEQAMFDRLNPQLERDRSALENNLTNQGFQRGTEAFGEGMAESGRNINDARLAITERGLGEQQGLFGMQQANRQRALQEMLALRNQPINEIGALMSGGQVSLPGVPGYNPGQVANTDLTGAVYNSAALANSQWQTQQQAAAQKQSALYGALGGLGGAAMYGGTGGFGASALGGLFKR
jgi:hypothetical protein